MKRKLVITKQFPGLYNHVVMDARRRDLNLSKRQVAAKVKVHQNTVYRAFAGKVTARQLWPIANVLGLDWAALHNLKLQESEFHLAVDGGKAG